MNEPITYVPSTSETLERDEFDELEELEATRNRNLIATGAVASIALGLLLLQRRRRAGQVEVEIDSADISDAVETARDTAQKLAALELEKTRLMREDAEKITRKQQEVAREGREDLSDDLEELTKSSRIPFFRQADQPRRFPAFRMRAEKKEPTLGERATGTVDETRERLARLSNASADAFSRLFAREEDTQDQALRADLLEAIQNSVDRVRKQYDRRSKPKSGFTRLTAKIGNLRPKPKKKTFFQRATDTLGSNRQKAQKTGMNLFSSVSGTAGGYTPKVQQAAKGLVGTAQDTLEEYRPKAQKAMLGLADTAQEAFEEYRPVAQKAAKEFTETAQETLKEYRPKAQKAAKEARETFSDLTEQLVERVSELAESFNDEVVPAIQKRGKKAQPVAMSAATRFASGIGDTASTVVAAPKVATKAVGKATEAAVDATTDTFTNLIWIAVLGFIAYLIYVPDPQRRSQINQNVRNTVSRGQTLVKELQGYADPESLSTDREI